MNIKSKLAAGGIGVLALGGSGLGLALASGASAASPAPATAPTAEVTDPAGAADTGPNVQMGDQYAADSQARPGNDTEVVGEQGSPSDGPGGHQDASGTADNQSTGEQ